MPLARKFHAEQTFQQNTAVKHLIFEILRKLWGVRSAKLDFCNKIYHWLLSLPQYFHSSEQSVVSCYLYTLMIMSLTLYELFMRVLLKNIYQCQSFARELCDTQRRIWILPLYIDVYISLFCCWHSACASFCL